MYELLIQPQTQRIGRLVTSREYANKDERAGEAHSPQYAYPPDLQDEAVQTVLRQTEALSASWAA